VAILQMIRALASAKSGFIASRFPKWIGSSKKIK
jgi:hypothetical protein